MMSRHWCARTVVLLLGLGAAGFNSYGQISTPVPDSLRGRIDAERSGMHDAASIRTVFYNYGMVGDYPPDPGNVDLSVFHSAEVPKGMGLNYTDGITPFVLARVPQRNGVPAYIMETGYRERQQWSPYTKRIMRFEPRPGYFQDKPAINIARSLAISTDNRTWPDTWIDKQADITDPGWGSPGTDTSESGLRLIRRASP